MGESEKAHSRDRFTLDRQLSDEAFDASQSRQSLGPLWDVAPIVVELLHRLAVSDPLTEPKHVGSQRALLLAYRSTAMALLHIIRLQFVEAAWEERRALEIIALAWHFLEVPGDFALWQEVFEHDLNPSRHPKRDEYWRKFHPRATQQYLYALSPELRDAYRRCNQRVHGTLGRHALAAPGEDLSRSSRAKGNLPFIDAQGHSALPVATEVFHLMDTVIIAVERLAEGALGLEGLRAWRREVDPLIASVRAEARRWRPGSDGTPTTD